MPDDYARGMEKAYADIQRDFNKESSTAEDPLITDEVKTRVNSDLTRVREFWKERANPPAQSGDDLPDKPQ